MQPERRLVQRIAHYLERVGARPIKIHGEDGSYQEAGISDLLVCYRGRFLAIEVKMPGKNPSPLQYKFLREIEAAGGVSLVARSVEEVERATRRIDRTLDH